MSVLNPKLITNILQPALSPSALGVSRVVLGADADEGPDKEIASEGLGSGVVFVVTTTTTTSKPAAAKICRLCRRCHCRCRSHHHAHTMLLLLLLLPPPALQVPAEVVGRGGDDVGDDVDAGAGGGGVLGRGAVVDGGADPGGAADHEGVHDEARGPDHVPDARDVEIRVDVDAAGEDLGTGVVGTTTTTTTTTTTITTTTITTTTRRDVILPCHGPVPPVVGKGLDPGDGLLVDGLAPPDQVEHEGDVVGRPVQDGHQAVDLGAQLADLDADALALRRLPVVDRVLEPPLRAHDGRLRRAERVYYLYKGKKEKGVMVRYYGTGRG